MAQWIIGFIEQHGYVGIVLLMILENVFPPIPSELIMPFAGFAAARGNLNAAGVVAAGTLGSLLGTLPWYVAGRLLTLERLKAGSARYGRWLTVAPADIDKANQWFERHGASAVFLGRMVPAVRSVISAPAGLTRMSLPRFLFWSLIGSMLWVGILVALGHVLEAEYERVEHWLDPVTKIILGMVIAVYVWRVVTFKASAPKT